MTTFPELRDFASEQDGDRITLPIGGVNYAFSRSIPMRLGMALTLARKQAEEMAKEGKLEDTPPALVGFTDEQMRRALIGDQWDRMLADDVTTDEFDTVYVTLFTYHMAGEKAAMRVWTGEHGEGDARPPASSASKARRTSPRSSTQRTSAVSRRRSSAGKTSSSTGTTSKRTSTASTK